MFIKAMQTINPDIEVVGEYVSSKTKIRCKCKKCGYEFSSIPPSLLAGEGCLPCGILKRAAKRTKTTQQFAKELNEVQPNIEIIGEYIGAHKLISCRCKLDGAEWNSYPSNLLNQSAGCPACKRHRSRGEAAISNTLDELGVVYQREHQFDGCRNILPLRFDFYLPEHNMVIEYDGQQHYSDVGIFGDNRSSLAENMLRDSIKDEYCEQHNITMMRIPYNKLRSIRKILTSHFQ